MSSDDEGTSVAATVAKFVANAPSDILYNFATDRRRQAELQPYEERVVLPG